MTRAALLLVPLCGCTLLDLSFEGSACATDHPCPGALVCDLAAGRCVQGAGGCGSAMCGGGQVCNPYLARCADDALCHAFDTEHVITCPRRDFYLSPSGNDGHDGLTPQTAWATVSAHMLSPGDRINVLAGEYTRSILTNPPQNDADVACPIELAGPDAGLARLTQPMQLGAMGWWLHDLDVAIDGGPIGAFGVGGSDIRFERVHFHSNYDPSGPRDIDGNNVDRLQVINCVFESAPTEMFYISGSKGLFQGNHFIGHGSRFAVPSDSIVRDNDFTGIFLGDTVQNGSGGPDALIVERNVFHELSEYGGGDFIVVTAAAVVQNNTFININSGVWAANTGVFRDNIVSGLRGGSALGAAAADAGYNLFDAVAQPYGDGDAGLHDVFAMPALDADHVPTASSPALDAADPAIAVPPGGGARADIGARERGATLTPDGRYCMPYSP
jgi:hypothetical protein